MPRMTPGSAAWKTTGLRAAHTLMLGRGLDCTLDNRPRLVPYDESLEAARAAIRAACVEAGVGF